MKTSAGMLLLAAAGTFATGSASYAQDAADTAAVPPVGAQPENETASSGSAVTVSESAADGAATEPELGIIAVASPDEPDLQAESEKKSANRFVDEVIVTAQKRDENIRDVPIAISAFNAEQLEAKQILNVIDLPKVTPGLTVSTLAGMTAFYLRGVGSDATILGDPLVVTYIDNVYLPSGFGQVQDFGPIEGIEVLKGPQGTLFGRNALGGALRIKSRDPHLQKFEASASAEYRSFDTTKVKGYVSVPIADTLAVAVSGLYSRGDSHIDGRTSPKLTPLPKETQESGRIKVLWAPADWMDLRLNMYKMSSDGTSTYAVNTEPSLAGFALGIRGEDPHHGANDEDVQKPVDATTYFGQLSFYLPWADIKLFGSDQDVVDRQSVDFDGSKIPIAVFQAKCFSYSKTGELQIVSNETSPGADWLEWIAGVYYFNALAGFDPAYLWAGGTDLANGIVAGIQVPQGIIDAIYALAGGLAIPEGAKFKFIGNIKTDSIAYYSQATARFTDWFSLTLGARYQNEERIVDDSSAGVALLNGDRLVYQSYNGYDNPKYRGTSKNFDPKVSLNFRPDWPVFGNDPLFYASYQTATTSLTFNAINILDAPEKVKETEMTAYEVGMKSRLLDGNVDFSAAAFWYDIDNPQVQTISLLAGGAVRFENAESQRIRGVEFDTLVLLFPELLDRSLVLTASGTYLDAVYTSFKDGSGFRQSGIYQDGQDFTGNRIVRSPKYSATVGLLQTFTTAAGPIEVGIDYYYNSGFSYLAQATPNASESAYDTWGASISYLYEPWNLRLSAYGRNLLNENYNLSRFVTDFGTLDIVAPRANYGVQVAIDF